MDTAVLIDLYCTSLISEHYITAKVVSIHWTGLLDWNTGLDYWTGLFSPLNSILLGRGVNACYQCKSVSTIFSIVSCC